MRWHQPSEVQHSKLRLRAGISEGCALGHADLSIAPSRACLEEISLGGVPARHTSVSIWLSKLQLVLLMKTRMPSCVNPPTALPAARPPACQPSDRRCAEATACRNLQVYSRCACLSKLLLLHVSASCQGILKASHSALTCWRHSHKGQAVQAAQHHCLGSHLQHGLFAAPVPSALLTAAAAADGPHLPTGAAVSSNVEQTAQHLSLCMSRK